MKQIFWVLFLRLEVEMLFLLPFFLYTLAEEENPKGELTMLKCPCYSSGVSLEIRYVVIVFKILSTFTMKIKIAQPQHSANATDCLRVFVTVIKKHNHRHAGKKSVSAYSSTLQLAMEGNQSRQGKGLKAGTHEKDMEDCCLLDCISLFV